MRCVEEKGEREGRVGREREREGRVGRERERERGESRAVCYTHLRAHETVLDIVCGLKSEKKEVAQESALQT